MSIFDIDGIESKIGYVFKDKMLLRQCFTHSSFANEHGQQDNERLEFFGDAIIQFVVTEYLYKKCSGDEGKMTVIRAELVSKMPLLKCVDNLQIREYILLGNGKKRSLQEGEKLFSSVYEALVAGIYLDGGLQSAKKFIQNTIIKDYEKRIKNLQKPKVKSEYKSEFQEYVQKHHLGSISYETLWKKGPDHSPDFRVAVLLNGNKIAEGEGGSKKIAESVAAEKALKKIKKGGSSK